MSDADRDAANAAYEADNNPFASLLEPFESTGGGWTIEDEAYFQSLEHPIGLIDPEWKPTARRWELKEYSKWHYEAPKWSRSDRKYFRKERKRSDAEDAGILAPRPMKKRKKGDRGYNSVFDD